MLAVLSAHCHALRQACPKLPCLPQRTVFLTVQHAPLWFMFKAALGPEAAFCRQHCHKVCSSKPEFMAVAGITEVQTAVCTDRPRCLHADGPSFSAEGFLNRYRNSWSAAYHAHKAMLEELSRRRGRPAAGAAPTVPVSELALPVPLSRFQWPMVRRSLHSVIRTGGYLMLWLCLLHGLRWGQRGRPRACIRAALLKIRMSYRLQAHLLLAGQSCLKARGHWPRGGLPACCAGFRSLQHVS